MVNGTTKSGFVFSVDENALDDLRLSNLKAVVLNESTGEAAKLQASFQMVDLLLGREQKELLYAHIGARHENGRVPEDEFGAELEDIARQAWGEKEIKK